MRGAKFAAAAIAMTAGAAAGDVVQVEISGTVTGGTDPVFLSFWYHSGETGSTIAGSGKTFFLPANLTSFELDGTPIAVGGGGDQTVYAGSDKYELRWDTSGPAFNLYVTFEGLPPGSSLPTAGELAQATAAKGSYHEGGNVYFDFDMRTLSVVAVPLPPAAWAGLAGLGVVGLTVAVRRRRLAG